MKRRKASEATTREPLKGEANRDATPLRCWRKLHLATDSETQEIVTDDLTDNAIDDAIDDAEEVPDENMFRSSVEKPLLPNQKTESKIRCKILNHFTNLGLPEYFCKNQ